MSICSICYTFSLVTRFVGVSVLCGLGFSEWVYLGPVGVFCFAVQACSLLLLREIWCGYMFVFWFVFVGVGGVAGEQLSPAIGISWNVKEICNQIKRSKVFNHLKRVHSDIVSFTGDTSSE